MIVVILLIHMRMRDPPNRLFYKTLEAAPQLVLLSTYPVARSPFLVESVGVGVPLELPLRGFSRLDLGSRTMSLGLKHL